MTIDLGKYRNSNALKVALEVLTPVREDRTYLKLRKAFMRGADKATKDIQEGKIKAPRGNPERFLSEPNRKWVALGNDDKLVAVPRVGTAPLFSDMAITEPADMMIAALRALKTEAEKGAYDTRFKELAGGEGGGTTRRRRRKAASK